ncbi:PQQ-binding-like beta-propeller repeat protein [Kitasatospora sp. NPDC094011]|uniref:outer membrane protein assembly factor BamB family protein n=1 Tax=Kitasatospora sp. NPDC094011 TaxID=3364090 RepID=UPI003804A0F0
MIRSETPMTVHGDPGRWTLTTPDVELGRPVVADGRVHLLVDRRLTVLDAVTGEPRFQGPHRIAGSESNHSPALRVLGDRIVLPEKTWYVPGAKPAAFTVLNAADGSLVRELALEATDGCHLASGVLVSRLHRGEHESLVTAYDLADGRRLWSRSDHSVHSAEVVAGRLVTTGRDGAGSSVRARDLRTGEPLWCVYRTAELDWASGKLIRPATGAEPEDDPVVFLWSRPRNTLTWLNPRTGEPLGSLTAPRGSSYPWFDAHLLDGGRTLVTSATYYRRPLRVLHPFEPELPVRTLRFFPHRVALYGNALVTADRWLYLTTKDGDLFSTALDEPGPLRRCRRIPRRRRPWFRSWRSLDLTAGPRHAYASLTTGPLDRLLALRAGQVLWSREGRSLHRPVPLGDGVLLREQSSTQSLLRLVDGETGAQAG